MLEVIESHDKSVLSLMLLILGDEKIYKIKINIHYGLTFSKF